MPRYQMTVTETYVNTFSVDADNEEQAEELAEKMSCERSFPAGHSESCERTIEASLE